MLALPGGLTVVDHTVCLDLASPTGVADVECAGQAPHAGKTLAGDHGDEAFTGLPAEGPQIHINARQRRSRRRDHHVPIVEPDDRYRLRYVEALLAQRVRGATGNLVIATEQRVRGLTLAVEQRRHRFSTRFL